jgi:V/A-type H+-transporting ATPase subunit I
MMFRPAQARWFETYVPREQTVKAAEVLASTGVVQLETDPRVTEPVDEERLSYFVEAFRALAAGHAHDLPGAGRQATALVGDPLHLANQALHQLRVWSARVEFLKAHVEHLRGELRHHELLAECLQAMRQAGLDLDSVFHKTRFLCKCLFACPRGGACEAEMDAEVDVIVHGSQHDFLYIASLPDQRHAIRHWVVERGCEQMGIPAWLSGEHEEQVRKVCAHLTRTHDELVELEGELKALRRDPAMAEARANVDTLHWYLRHAAGTLTEGPFCHVTGWTTARNPLQLREALEKAGIRAVLRLPQPPARSAPPVATLDNWWARPFQPFLVMWGTPDRLTVDPSGLLPVIVPLLFGYMFPDVGHGLLLVLLGLALYRRSPRTRFLMPCGLAAMVFGALFGEVFGFHGLVSPLWMKPLDDPLAVLAIPMGFGVVLMLLGLAFAGFEAHWRGELRAWLLLDAAVLLLYVSLLAGVFTPRAFWFTGLAIGHYFIGALVLASAGERGMALLNAAGQLLLSIFELAMNTLSFLRVGAFALAHAALSLAILTLADGVDSPWAWGLIILLGNLFGVVMEGLLVFVQTTRLVLFEFFIRFLHAEGRLFRAVGKVPGGSGKGN